MKADREYRLVWKPTGEIMDGVSIPGGTRLNSHQKKRIDGLIEKVRDGGEFEVQYFIGGYLMPSKGFTS